MSQAAGRIVCKVVSEVVARGVRGRKVGRRQHDHRQASGHLRYSVCFNVRSVSPHRIQSLRGWVVPSGHSRIPSYSLHLWLVLHSVPVAFKRLPRSTTNHNQKLVGKPTIITTLTRHPDNPTCNNTSALGCGGYIQQSRISTTRGKALAYNPEGSPHTRDRQS